jgi:hypothetical protein
MKFDRFASTSSSFFQYSEEKLFCRKRVQQEQEFTKTKLARKM